MKKCVGVFLVAMMMVSISMTLLPTSIQAQSFSISLPVPFPPKIGTVKIRQGEGTWYTNNMGSQLNAGINSLSGLPVQVQAQITTNASMKQDGSRGPIPSLTTAGANKPKLHYSTNYASVNPPTWTTVELLSVTGPTTNNVLFTNTYTVFFEIPSGAIVNNQVVTYYIEARDTNNESDAKMGASLVMNNRTRAGGLSWPLSWDDTGTTARMNWSGETAGTTSDGSPPPNETKTMADPAAIPAIVSRAINQDLNISQFWAGVSSTELFAKMKVYGTINKGSNDLSAANAYVVAILNRARPNKGGSNEDMAKGTFAFLYLENADQTAGALPGSPWLCDLEASLAAGAVRPTTAASGLSAYKSGNELHFKVALSALGVTALTQDPYYDPNNLVIAAGAAVIDARNMDNIQFIIHDISNGVSLYRKNYSFKPSEVIPPSTTFTLSGEARNAVSNALLTSCTGCVKILDGVGSQVAIANINASGVYSTALDPGIYTVRVEVPNTLVNEIRIDASEQGAGTTLPQNVKQYNVAQGGDISGDNIVDKSDVAVFVPKYKQPASACPSCDLNGDGTINLKDFGIMLRNWCKCPPSLAQCTAHGQTGCCPLPTDPKCK